MSAEAVNMLTNKEAIDKMLLSDHICNELMKEVKRSGFVKLLRKRLTDLCKELDLNPPIYTWERWQARCKLFDLQQDALEASLTPSSSSSAVQAKTLEEMLPERKFVDPGLMEDLERGGFTPKSAQHIGTELSLLSCQCAKELREYTALLPTGAANVASLDKLHRVRVAVHKHSLDFSIGRFPKQILKLTRLHYDKLRALYSSFCGTHGRPDAAAAAAAASSDAVSSGSISKATELLLAEMHTRMYILLSRYSSLLGHGFQMALGEDCFRVLRKRIGTEFECFASPLNCTNTRFTSAFPSADVFFGSVGNFFSFSPLEGSFEANPPFIPEVMAAMVMRIHSLLAAATGPMSFVVIVPGWLSDPAWVALTASIYKRAFYLVAAKDHGYCDGAQHQRQDRFRESTYDTGVFILQNRSGAAKWPTGGAAAKGGSDVEVEAEIRVAMARAIPTEMMRLRRLRDGRGHGDLDGGGGVYKGKKANAKTKDGDGGDTKDRGQGKKPNKSKSKEWKKKNERKKK